MEEFGFDGASALVCPQGDRVRGMERGELLARAGEAELLVNISGHLRWQPLIDLLPHRVFVDLDPGFTQIWHSEGGNAAGLDGHQLFFTVGENVGTGRCELPTGGIEWRPVRQPVVLERWPMEEGGELFSFTTIASWRGAYGRASWGGRSFGLKAHEFRRFTDLPGRAGMPFRIALDIHPADGADTAALEARGWELIDPAAVATTAGFAGFVRSSGAEFSAAQGIYVDTRSGWFSDRTVRYLACGRPALVQDTGFGDHLPVGEGLLSFRTLDEAVEGAQAIAGHYPRHRAAARRLAEEYFAPEPSLRPVLESAGVSP
jgi:hypothetical protein